MVTVRIATGEILDITGKVTYVKKVSDIGDITKANSSYSWQLTFPKTPNNIKIFQGLGISGSGSRIPYQKITCQILDNGVIIEPNGNLIITESTKKEYKGHVKAGIIDFLQDISNDKISDIIDLSDLGHLNTTTNIINTFYNDLPYKYIVAYYNGQQFPDIGGITNLNPLALSPSINVKYLWDKIFDHYGWTYAGNFNLSDVWMTYPNAIGFSDEEASTVLQAVYNPEIITLNSPEVKPTDITVPFIDPDFINRSSPPLSFIFNVVESGWYNIKASLSGIINSLLVFQPPIPITWNVHVGGQYNPTTYQSGESLDINIFAPALTDIYVQVLPSYYPFQSIFIFDGWMSIETRGIQPIDFSEALIKIKVKDFFKEIMFRNALTPFVDVGNKNIVFRTLDERLSAPALDWSKKYAGRDSEKYVYENYAQENLVKHKYNDENQDYADGVIVVDNENQPTEKTLYQSFSYAPEQTFEEIKTNLNTYNVQNFRMFDVEIKIDENGDITAKYKELKDRFYFIKSRDVDEQIYVGTDLATKFPLAEYSEVFANIIDTKFSNIGRVINDAKIVDIDLVLSKMDILNMLFHRLYYFEQEKGYFLLNQLTWKSGEISTGEFVKINY